MESSPYADDGGFSLMALKNLLKSPDDESDSDSESKVNIASLCYNNNNNNNNVFY